MNYGSCDTKQQTSSQCSNSDCASCSGQQECDGLSDCTYDVIQNICNTQSQQSNAGSSQGNNGGSTSSCSSSACDKCTDESQCGVTRGCIFNAVTSTCSKKQPSCSDGKCFGCVANCGACTAETQCNQETKCAWKTTNGGSCDLKTGQSGNAGNGGSCGGNCARCTNGICTKCQNADYFLSGADCVEECVHGATMVVLAESGASCENSNLKPTSACPLVLNACIPKDVGKICPFSDITNSDVSLEHDSGDYINVRKFHDDWALGSGKGFSPAEQWIFEGPIAKLNPGANGAPRVFNITEDCSIAAKVKVDTPAIITGRSKVTPPVLQCNFMRRIVNQHVGLDANDFHVDFDPSSYVLGLGGVVNQVFDVQSKFTLEMVKISKCGTLTGLIFVVPTGPVTQLIVNSVIFENNVQKTLACSSYYWASEFEVSGVTRSGSTFASIKTEWTQEIPSCTSNNWLKFKNHANEGSAVISINGGADMDFSAHPGSEQKLIPNTKTNRAINIIVKNCRFDRNYGRTGVMRLYGPSSNLQLSSNTHVIDIENCTFTNNVGWFTPTGITGLGPFSGEGILGVSAGVIHGSGASGGTTPSLILNVRGSHFKDNLEGMAGFCNSHACFFDSHCGPNENGGKCNTMQCKLSYTFCHNIVLISFLTNISLNIENRSVSRWGHVWSK